jgi:hypothetical protein
MRARCIPARDGAFDGWTDSEPISLFLERCSASDIRGTLLAPSDADNSTLKAIRHQSFKLSITRHCTHHPRGRQTALCHRDGKRTGDLQGLSDAKRQHGFEHLLLLLVVADATRPGLIDAPPTPAERGRGCSPWRW